MGKFEIKVEKSGDMAKVQINGVIDEDVDFSVHPLTGSSKVEMDLGGIKSINSCGIREWIKWLGDAGQAQVTYVNCPKIIIDQVNMVQGFLPAQGKVASFYVPYYSESAGSEENVLFVHGKEFTETSLTPPAEVKDKEGNVMEMDVVEAKYFKFIKRA
jgi:hypothetical protein